MIQLSISKTSLDKLTNSINEAVLIGVTKLLEKTKEKMLDKSLREPHVYLNNSYAYMNKVLDVVGLAGYTSQTSGHLAKAWDDTIKSIKVDKRYKNKIVINWFNPKYLQESTPWVGVNKKPKVIVRSESSKKGGFVDMKRNRSLFIMLGDSSYRPLPGHSWYSKVGPGGITDADWSQNPYPGYGYWFLYEQGFGSYLPHNFIKNAYETVFGQDAFTMFNMATKIRLSPIFEDILETEIARVFNR